MWKSFWGNAACCNARPLPLPLRLNLLKRATQPVLDFRCSRWPPQQVIKREMDAMQRKMAATLLHVRPFAHEEPCEYVMRRNRMASALCQRFGWWSARWWKRACDWDAHIRRERNQYSWCHALAKWHDNDWLEICRALASGSSITSRTRTRAIRGRVHQRWESGIMLARSSGV